MIPTLLCLLLLLFPVNAYAYIDPGTGSIVIQVLVGVAAVVALFAKGIYYRIRRLFGAGNAGGEEDIDD